MNRLVLLAILVAVTCEFLIQSGLLPRPLKYLPELLSATIAIVVVVLGTRERFRFVRPAYWFVFGAIALIMLCGALANSLQPGPMFVGIRNYLRAMPIFFLPAVYAFSERQLRSQLLLLLVLCLLQVLLAIRQRLAGVFTGSFTGDQVTGTLIGSGLLSIFLISSVCVLTAAFLRKRIKGPLFVVLFLVLLIPTSINETKATVLLLPLGVLFTFVVGSGRGTRLRNAVIASCVLAIFASIFIPAYDYWIEQGGRGKPIAEFFSDKDSLSYMSKGVDVGAAKAGHVDAIVTPLKRVMRDPTHFAFGYGIGNASQSMMGEDFKGKYFQIFAPFLQSSASFFILEVGILGLLLILVIDYLIFRDSRVVAERDTGLIGVLALGWIGVVPVITLSTFYSNMIPSTALSYLFWYFSGVIAAQRVRLAYRAGHAPAPRGSGNLGSRGARVA